MPTPLRRGRPRTWDICLLINDIFFRIRTGCPWRDIPERYGPWWRVYHLFAHFHARGVWHNVHTRLLTHVQEQGKLSWEISVDSTTTRGHFHAAGARKDSTTRHPTDPDHHGFSSLSGRVVNKAPCRDQCRLRGDVMCYHPGTDGR
ncbi:transposase [Corynebacterium mastitidis]|uniref:Transposase n=1 Tax=Corynebacterium mastitidis TaxID=161890 RepID=A0ABU8P149_9CORY